jgi:Bacteriocin-protection, YdeI or OmpD-Associated/Domain of unknown function (DUF1905)
VKVAEEGENFLVRVPFDVRAVFGQARPPVVISVDGYSFRSTVAVYGGEYFIGIRRSHREAAGLSPRQEVSITLTRDDEPRVIDPPADLAAALKKNAVARAAWDALSFSHKREHVTALEDAKKPETRARRLENTIAMLLAAKPVKKVSAKRAVEKTAVENTRPKTTTAKKSLAKPRR